MNLVFQTAHYKLLFDSEAFKTDNLKFKPRLAEMLPDNLKFKIRPGEILPDNLNYKVRPGEILPVNLNHILSLLYLF